MTTVQHSKGGVAVGGDLNRVEASQPIPRSSGTAVVIDGKHGAVAVPRSLVEALERLNRVKAFKSRPNNWTCGLQKPISIDQMRTLMHLGLAGDFTVPGEGRFAVITQLGRKALNEIADRKAAREAKRNGT